MKGFLNKRDKIKWENTPFEPALTDEDLIDRIEYNARKLIEGDPTPPLATTINNLTMDLIEHTINIGYLNDVNVSGVRTGDVLTYLDGEWGNTHPEKWVLIDTLTADGTVDKIRKSLDGYLYTGFFIASNLKTGAADAAFGVVFEFDSSTFDTPVRKAIGDVTGGIPASGQSYINACYEKDGNMWNGYMTTKVAASTSVASRIERLDSYYIEPDMPLGDWIQITTIEIRTTSSGAVLPEGSTFTIYGKR